MFKGPLFNIFTRASDNKASNIIIVISNKISPLSVKRHKIKRQLKEIIRHAHPLVPLPSGLNLIIVVKKDILGKNYHEMKEEFEKNIVKINQAISNFF